MKSISDLYKMQKELDARIIKEKGLEGQNLLPNTVLALDVELGEMANEWRGFKHWSSDQEPRMEKECKLCEGFGQVSSQMEVGNHEHGFDVVDVDVTCPLCEGEEDKSNPLLEEYVDCLHFFLSIARQYDWKDDVLYFVEDAVEDLRAEGFDGGITGAILEMKYWLLKLHMEDKPNKKLEEALGYSTKESHFRNAFFIFIAIGLVGFGFTLEQIFQAYLDKNKINHERQDNGY